MAEVARLILNSSTTTRYFSLGGATSGTYCNDERRHGMLHSFGPTVTKKAIANLHSDGFLNFVFAGGEPTSATLVFDVDGWNNPNFEFGFDVLV